MKPQVFLSADEERELARRYRQGDEKAGHKLACAYLPLVRIAAEFYFFQHRTLLHARTPRATCPECGVRKAATPWARAGSGFTLLFEAYVLALAKSMPIANAAERLGEHDTRLWRIVEHYVWRAVEKLDLSLVRRIAADETSARRGHDYISLFVDMARRKVVYVADGKDAATVKEFADFLEAHGGRREAVTDASIDMGAAFEAGIKENFPNAEITFDKFHVIKLANEAVDQVRRVKYLNSSAPGKISCLKAVSAL